LESAHENKKEGGGKKLPSGKPSRGSKGGRRRGSTYFIFYLSLYSEKAIDLAQEEIRKRKKI